MYQVPKALSDHRKDNRKDQIKIESVRSNKTFLGNRVRVESQRLCPFAFKGDQIIRERNRAHHDHWSEPYH